MTSRFKVGDLVLDRYSLELLQVQEVNEAGHVRVAARTSYGYWGAPKCFAPLHWVQPFCQRLIDDLDRARTEGTTITYGNVLEHLRNLLEEGDWRDA